MKQTSTLTQRLTLAQEQHAADLRQSAQATTYRLYTEDLPGLAALCGRHFDGFTLLKTTGYWRGFQEAGAVVEVVGTTLDVRRIHSLAEDIRRTNGQTAVLVTSTVGEQTLIVAPANAHEAAE